MNERARRIKQLFDESGKTYRDLEILTGITKSSLQRYANGVTTKIPLEAVEKLEKAFEVPRGYIMGWQAEQEPEQEPEQLADITAQLLLNPQHLTTMEKYLRLSEADQYAIRLMIDSLSEKQKKTDEGVSQAVEKVSLLETE
ncbi:MAG: helix-turn-helix transcriptional regulator [Mogibacterium sp.]|nr:helix-turn-helix transcriptional regulator [Mogibacterium sp.]